MTYAAKIEPSETRIDWSRPAHRCSIKSKVFRPIPAPGSRWSSPASASASAPSARPSPKARAVPGTLLDGKLTIACGKGAVRLTQVQRAGKRPMSAEDFLRGAALRAGSVLD